MKKLSLLALTIFGLIVLGCGSKETSSNSDETADTVVQTILPKLPPPSEVAARIQATGADFNAGFINPLAQKDAYLGAEKTKAAANLGVYVADMGYLVAYDQSEEAVNYLVASEQMADALGVKKQFGRALEFRYHEKLESNEKVKSAFDSLFSGAENNVSDEEFKTLQAAFIGGYYIESLHLLSSLVLSYPEDLPEETRNLILTPAIRAILNQKQGVLNLITYMETLNIQSKPVIYGQLIELRDKYNTTDINKLIETGDANTSLNAGMVKDIAQHIETVRSTIVSL